MRLEQTPDLLGPTQQEQNFNGFSAEEWNIAVSHVRLEALRQQLVKASEEESDLRENAAQERDAIATCKRKFDANSNRINELLAKEKQIKESKDVIVRSAKDEGRSYQILNGRLVALRLETDSLAREVTDIAATVTAQCSTIHELRRLSKTVRLECTVHGVSDACKTARKNYQSYMSDVQKCSASVIALREQVFQLRDQLGAAEGAVSASAVVGRSNLSELKQTAARLRKELLAQRAEMIMDVKEDVYGKRKEGLLEEVSAQAKRLTQARAGTKVIADQLHNAEKQRTEQYASLVDAQMSMSTLARKAALWERKCRMLETELQQQRSSTVAWRDSAANFAIRREHLVTEVAKAWQTSRLVLDAKKDELT